MLINSNFWTKKVETQKKLMLKNNPAVKVMGEGLGLSGIQQLTYELLKWKDKMKLIICTGKNVKQRKTESADLLITKAGGLTCFEALSKWLPIYIY
jgi:processive 1,2-diacylglycerol beta-glucosyltransferase